MKLGDEVYHSVIWGLAAVALMAFVTNCTKKLNSESFEIEQAEINLVTLKVKQGCKQIMVVGNPNPVWQCPKPLSEQ